MITFETCCLALDSSDTQKKFKNNNKKNNYCRGRDSNPQAFWVSFVMAAICHQFLIG